MGQVHCCIEFSSAFTIGGISLSASYIIVCATVNTNLYISRAGWWSMFHHHGNHHQSSKQAVKVDRVHNDCQIYPRQVTVWYNVMIVKLL